MTQISRIFRLALILSFLGGCALRHTRPPTVATAETLRGKTLKELEKVLGRPSDTEGSERAYWFLSEESENHPDPTPILYEFRFHEGKFVRLKKAL